MYYLYYCKCRDFNASVSQIACNISTMLVVCSVQLAEERRGRRGRMGDNLWSGLGEMFGFSWHLHFHYRASMIYCVSLSELINFQTFCHYVYPAPHLYPCECRPSPSLSAVCIPASSISSLLTRGWWWWRRCASVCPRACLGRLCHPISAQPIRGQYCDQGPIRGQYGPVSSHHSSHRHVRTQKQSAIDHKQIWPIFIFTKVSKISEIVNKLHSYSAIIGLAPVICSVSPLHTSGRWIMWELCGEDGIQSEKATNFDIIVTPIPPQL